MGANAKRLFDKRQGWSVTGVNPGTSVLSR
jgi:hypothetical protein